MLSAWLRKKRFPSSARIDFEAQLDRELDAVNSARDCVKKALIQGARAKARGKFKDEPGSPRGTVNGGDASTGNKFGGKKAGEELEKQEKILQDKETDKDEKQSRTAYDRARDSNLLGLAFSGGGIRSATFNLGVIQRLAKLRLLHRVDYLSTVSGGGYIGGWLSTWVHRHQDGILGVEDCLGDGKRCGEGSSRLPEPRQVRWLREFSNYLTPRVGAFSTDTLSGVATYLRNLLLNQTMLVAFGASLLILPWLMVALLPHFSKGWIEGGLALAAALLLAGSMLAGYETLRADLGLNDNDITEKVKLEERKKAAAAIRLAKRRYRILFICFAAAAVFAGVLITYNPSTLGAWWSASFGGAYGVGTLAGWLLGWRLGVRRQNDSNRDVHARKLKIFFPWGALFAALGLGVMLYLWARLVGDSSGPFASALPAIFLGPLVVLGIILFTITLHLGLAGRRVRESGRELWSTHGAHQMRFGVIWAAFAGASLFGPLSLMLVSNWIAALGGATWILTTIAGVVAGSGSTTGGRGGSKISELAARIAPYVFVVGVLLIVSYGVYRAMWWQWSVETVSPRDAICQPVPGHPVYEINLKAESGVTEGRLYEPEPAAFECLPCYLAESASLARGHWSELVGVTLGLLAIALLLSWRVDINVFGFHMFYRNRIERCYMGASNLTRRPHPLTGLDPTDAPKLMDLVLAMGGDGCSETELPAQPPSSTTTGIAIRAKELVHGLAGYILGKRNTVTPITPLPAERLRSVQRPFPIINTALNITSSRNLAWQERKAASFTFTPMHCGYEIQEPDGKTLPCFRPTADYVRDDDGWISLGVPITISGAAASPNAGYHTSAATAFLMTVFNVRLGWWLQNPRYEDRWRRAGPKLALPLFIQELFGMTTDQSDYVYLSDGGHFENLGIYELVRRRCRYIIASDAGCDPKCSFEDLGNAVRKVQIDLGIDIDIDPRAIRPDPSTGRSRFHCAVGRIHYERVDKGAPPGFLLYVKCSLASDAPADILQYAADHPDFPHETTADQWYSESQFESYRKLGDHVAGSVLADAVGEQRALESDCEADLEELFTALSERWYPPSAEVRASFSKYGEAVEAIFERIRGDESLRFLDQQIYPEWLHLTDPRRALQRAPIPQMLPENAWEIRAGFYLCNSLLQLMERVYHDLNLEEQHGHPDNRGWMNLFRHWSWAGMLRVTWAISASMYGARFQRFCRRRLDLEVGTVCCGDLVLLTDRNGKGELNFDNTGLNFLEAKHVSLIMKNCFPDRENSLSVAQLSLRVISPFKKDEEEAFAFPFAFALIDARAGERELIYYRVRDHLREIGLGRKGLAVLLDDNKAEKVTELDKTKQESLSTVIREADYPALQRLWTSVVVAKEERGRGGLERGV